MPLPRPVDAQPEYGRRLGDAGYWSPYVVEVLGGHGLPVAQVEPPFVGTFPTFIVGDVVVKLFGPGFDGEQSSRRVPGRRRARHRSGARRHHRRSRLRRRRPAPGGHRLGRRAGR